MSVPPREIATNIVRRLQEVGFSAYWVGGCVRDYLLGLEPHDYDVATDALADEVERLFPHTIPVGRKFGVIIVLEDDQQFQVATFRAESDYRDGRRPETVSFGDPRADASRRDFTFNGLFYDPIAGKTHDWVGGEADLRAGIVRTIGTPEERFGEDHLRLLRAVRFSARLGFEIEPKTLVAIKELAPKIKVISAERIRDELNKLFAPPPTGFVLRAGMPSPARRGLELLRDTGLIEHVLPELVPTITCEQSPDYHPEGTVFTHLCLMLDNMLPDSDPLLPWLVLLHDIAKPVTASKDPATGTIHFYDHEEVGADMSVPILERLKFPRKQIDDIADVVRHHMRYKDALKMKKSSLRRLLMRETFALDAQLQRLDFLGSLRDTELYDFLMAEAAELAKQPDMVPPLLTGSELIELGIKPGPPMGALLAELREKQLSDELTTKAAATEWVRKRIESVDK